MKIYTVEYLNLEEGALVERYKSESGQFIIPAVMVGEKGRGRKLGIIPVQLLQNSQSEFERDGKVRIKNVKLGETKSGKPKFIEVEDDGEDDQIILVLRTPFGFRGFNVHRFTPIENFEILTEGIIADGEAGRMAQGSQFILKVKDGGRIDVRIEGRMYGRPKEYAVIIENKKIKVLTKEEEEIL